MGGKKVKKKRCAVPNCNEYAVPGDGKTVFRFPKDKTRRRKWIKCLGNRLLLTASDTLILSNRFVCPAHFEEEMFWDRLHDHLKRNAIPTLFAPGHQSLTDIQMAAWDESHGIPNVVSFTGIPDASIPAVEEMVLEQDVSLVADLIENSASEQILPPTPCSQKGKRPFDEVEPGDGEDGQAEKCPRRDTHEHSTPRRSLESLGARERSPAPKRMTLKRICEAVGITTMTPDSLLLAKSVQEYRQDALTVRRKLVVAQRKNSSLAKIASRRFVDMVDELTISPLTKQIVQAELVNFKRHKNKRKWTLNDKLSALSIYKRSTRAYRFLRQYIILPSESILKSLLKEVPLHPGISDTLLNLLKKKVDKMSPLDKNCVVSFDEMFLRGRLFYNVSRNIVTGFENYGHRGCTNRVADHALVFMAQGLHEKWTFPVAYFFVSKTCPSTMLKLLIQDVITALLGIGLNVFGTVSDQGPTNRGAISELRQENGDSVFYSVNDQRLVHMWDMPHILKNVRNNLLSSNLEFGGGKVAKWRHLIEYFKVDESLFKMSPLTYKHMNPQGRDKMKVSYAAQTLSQSVSNAIRTFHALSNNLGHCLPFADLCSDVDLFFDLCNGPRQGEKIKESRTNVTENSIHHSEWGKILTSLQQWTFIRKSDGKRHVPPCVQGWMENIKSLRVLWRKAQSAGLTCLKLRHLNQDPVENLFCLVRQCGGSATDLTDHLFTAALKTSLITRFIVNNIRDKNCMSDDSFFITDLKQLILSSRSSTSSCPPPNQEDFLIRGDSQTLTRLETSGSDWDRQGPAKLWAIILNKIASSVHCQSCLSKITSLDRTSDTLFARTIMSSLEVFPSAALITYFLAVQTKFEASWKRILHKPKLLEQVVDFCKDTYWHNLFCEDHRNEPYVSLFFETTAKNLVSLKVQHINGKMREKVVRRTRQIDGKNSDGLRASEDSAELHPHDLQLLQGQLSTPATAPVLPLTPNRALTPAGLTTPAPATPSAAPITPASAAPITPASATPLSTPRLACTPQAYQTATPARQRVLASWMPPPQSTPGGSSKQNGVFEEQVESLAKTRKLNTLNLVQLKDFLRLKKLKVGGNKPDLVARVEQFFNVS